MTIPDDTVSLVADIGGTNTRVALAEDGAVDAGTVRRYRNADHPDLGAVLSDYLGRHDNPDCAGVCVAMAGPVMDGRGELTNLDWTVDRADLADVTRAETAAVLNDLQAQGHALGHIAGDQLRRLVEGKAGQDHAAKLVIGIGTGFNAVSVFDPDGGRVVPPSEAGHTTMPVRSEADLRLARHVEKEHGFPSIEDVLSGRGLGHIHRWLSVEVGEDARMDSAEIVEAAGTDPLAAEAVDIFARLLGNVAGDLALHHLPFGGVFLVGGVARAVTPYLGDTFASAFRDKGRFADYMDQFAITVVEDDYAALTGCARHLVQLRG